MCRKGGYGAEMYEKERDRDRDRDRNSKELNEDVKAILKASLDKIKRVCFGIVKGKPRR